MKFRILLAVVTVILLGYSLSSAELVPPQSLPVPEAVIKESPMISMDFKDANLKDIFKIFSQQSGLNFIAGEDIAEKRVTLYLDDVPISDALDSIMEANDLTYEQAENSRIFIVEASGKPEIKTRTNVYYLKYAQVKPFEDTAGTETGAGTEMGAGADAGGGKESEYNIIRVMTELLTPHGKLLADQRTNSIIITDIPRQFPLIEQTLAKLDIKTPQVMIEVEVLDVKLIKQEDLGLEFGTSVGSFTGPKRNTYFPLGKKLRTAGTASSTFTMGTLSLSELSVTLDMLTSDSDTKILARPRILTLNNETAKISITTDSAVGLLSIVESETNVQADSAERMESGISLEVTPQVSDDGYITMAVNPRVVSIVASRDLGVTKQFYDPETRGAETVVRVKDGETLVIGGLIKTNNTEVIKKVPFLSDIPFLGKLFRNENIDQEQRELIIFITPRIIREELYLAEAPREELWLSGKREQDPLMPKEEAMEEALSQWEK